MSSKIIINDNEKESVDIEISFLEQGTQIRESSQQAAVAPSQTIEIDDGDRKERSDDETQIELERTLKILRCIALFAVALSVFFFGWSVLSFVVFPPMLGLYGLVSFSFSFGIGIYIISEKVLHNGCRERSLLLISFGLNVLYSLGIAAAGLDEGYDEGNVAFAAICALIWLILLITCRKLMTKVNYLFLSLPEDINSIQQSNDSY